MRIKAIFAAMAFLAALQPSVSPAEEPTVAVPEIKVKEDSLQSLTRENSLLRDRVRVLESTPAITGEALAAKNLQRLQDIARDTRAQRQTMADFEGFVKWMTGNLSGYAKYIQAGSVAAGFAKILPIPYAGQASLLTKFVSQGILSLNAASVAINKYLDTSQQFLGRMNTLDSAKPAPADISELARFADSQLLPDMNDVQQKLTATSEISTSALAFLETVNSYVGSTDEYWNRTKSILSRKEPDKKEKSYLSESILNLKNGAESFNARLKTFDERAKKDAPLIKSMLAYDDLVRELAAKTTQAKN